MTHSTIGPNFNQAFDAHLNFAAQITFDFVIFTNKLTDRSNIASEDP